MKLFKKKDKVQEIHDIYIANHRGEVIKQTVTKTVADYIKKLQDNIIELQKI